MTPGMRRSLLAGLIWIAGCETSAARCARVDREDVAYRYDQIIRDRPAPPAAVPGDGKAAAKIRTWAKTLPAGARDRYAWEVSPATVKELTADFAGWASRDRPSDSVVAVLDAILARRLYEPREPAPVATASPPPRPSDVEWYREHCWEGKPR